MSDRTEAVNGISPDFSQENVDSPPVDGTPEKEKTNPRSKPPRPGQIYDVMAQIYKGGTFAKFAMKNIFKEAAVPPLPPSAGKLHTWKIDGQKVLLLREDDGSSQIWKLDELVDELLNYLSVYFQSKPAYAFTKAEAKSCADKISALVPCLEARPADVRFANETGDCFRKVPQDLAPGDTSAWDEVMGRMTNSEAFMCWVSYVFTPEGYRGKSAWLYGEGGNGKSSILHALRFALGNACKGLQVAPWAGTPSTFWAETFLGVRLVAFSDYRSKLDLDNAIFMGLTGDDPIEVNRKFLPSFNTEMSCMLMFLANSLPGLTSQEAMQRRFLLFKIDKAPANDGQAYRDLLCAQVGAFVHKCHELRKGLYPDVRSPIVGDAASVAELIELGEDADAIHRLWYERHVGESQKHSSESEVMQSLKEFHNGHEAKMMATRRWFRALHPSAVVKMPGDSKAVRGYKNVTILKSSFITAEELAERMDALANAALAKASGHEVTENL